MGRYRLALAAGGGGLLAWLPVASVLVCYVLGTLPRTTATALPFAWLLYWRDYGNHTSVMRALWPCAGIALLLVLIPAMGLLFVPAPRRRLRPARDGEVVPMVQRANSDLHGSADWLSMDKARSLFPGPQGVVVGEAYRVDKDDLARGITFDPDVERTWGRSGTVPLLIDPCTSGSTHGAVFAGSGGYKTTSITIPTLAYWVGSVVVLDPSCQVGPMCTRMRRGMGQEVVTVTPGRPGFNVLDWIDPADPLAETYVVATVDRLFPDAAPGSTGDGDGQVFPDRAKELLTCLLADLLWSDLPADRKTLAELRARICTPEHQIKGMLEDMAVESRSPLARDLARTLFGVFHETFSGYYSYASTATAWLSIEPYAAMVSGGRFPTDAVADGGVTVFVQIPMDALKATPELGRVVIGSLLDAVYRRDGAVSGRVLFLLDEINLLGRMKVLEDARDAGRKSGITLVGMWQTIGQVAATWGPTGLTSWMSSCSWTLFARVTDRATSEEVSKLAGTYTVLAHSQGMSTSAQSTGTSGGSTRGKNEGLTEQRHDLVSPWEVRTQFRADEAIIFPQGEPALRCGRPIYWRRPDLAAAVDVDRFRQPAIPQPQARNPAP